MKKIIIILATLLAVSAVSCKKETPLPEGGPAKYKIAFRSTPKETKQEVKLDVGDSSSVKVYATTRDTGVREQLTATFTVPDSAASYLEKNVKLLPAFCYKFTKDNVVIDRYNKDSRTNEVKINYPGTLESGTYGLPLVLAKVEGSERASADTTVVIVITMIAR